MKQPDTKKLLLGCLVIMLLMIAYTKVKTGEIERGSFDLGGHKTEEEQISGTSDGQVSLLLTDRLNAAPEASVENDHSEENPADTERGSDEEILGPAEPMDVESARKEPYGLVVELDYVSADRISLHGNFGYMVFSLESENSRYEMPASRLECAVTFEELGGINMGGAAYTDIVAGDGIALIIPGIHNEEIARRRKFLYREETNEITGGVVAPQWMMEKMAVQDYSDAVEDAEKKDALKLALGNSEYKECRLLYGPVVIPEFNSNTYGFLSADGENLEDIWYGMWNADINTIVNLPLFQ